MNLAFPFATVEDAEKSTHTIYYSGEARRVAANEINNFMPFDKIPWSRISNGKLRDMLQRYVFEREQNDIII